MNALTDIQKIIAAAFVSAVVSGGGIFVATQRQVDRVEVRQEEQYRSLMTRIDEVGSRTRQGHDDIRTDLNAIRGEIMAIIKERR